MKMTKINPLISLLCALLVLGIGLSLSGCTATRQIEVIKKVDYYDSDGKITSTVTTTVKYLNEGNDTNFGNLELDNELFGKVRVDNYSSTDKVLLAQLEMNKTLAALLAAGAVTTATGTTAPIAP